MNHKPGSVATKVADRHLSGKTVPGLFRAAYPRLTDGPPAWPAEPTTTLLDFAPDEACRSNGVAAAEVGSYPTISPLPGNL